VYPLLSNSGDESPHVAEVCAYFHDSLDHQVSLAPVRYQFQKGATHMLVLSLNNSADISETNPSLSR